MKKQVTVVFPMAGEGQRFGGKFKPFLKIFDKTFIEIALQPFLKHKDSIKEIIFIVRQDHAIQFKVYDTIANFNLPVVFRTLAIEPTNSPVETINSLFYKDNEIHDVIFCDCDHSLNVDDIFEAIHEDKYDCIIPGWQPIEEEDKTKWSIASAMSDNTVFDIKEKEFPEGGCFYGVIGCYYFKKYTGHYLKYLSEVIASMVKKGNFEAKIIPVTEAEFFGDPERLNKLYAEKKASTIFCDLDGTVIKHENVPLFTSITLLEGAKEKLIEWRDNNAFIIFTTSRDEQFRSEMESLLRKEGICYEYLVMGLPPGTRYLINDKKPYSEITMAKSFEVVRDIGIKEVQLGNSFAEYSQEGNISTKTIDKDAGAYQIKKFESQYASMKAISDSPLLSKLVPKIYEMKDVSYGMEFLKGYKGLHLLSSDDRIIILEKLFKELPRLYYRVHIEENTYWLNKYLNEKIFAKKQIFEELGLDATEVFDILNSLTIPQRQYLSPEYLRTFFHGDLTYENIMVKDGDFKLLDFDSDNLPGAPEMDMGKLFQSAFAGYEYWDTNDFVYNRKESDVIIDFYADFLQQDRAQVVNKATFYCALHLIRMIPYQAKRSMNRANKALELSKKYLKYVNETL
jgi:hypothetical protein